MGSKRLKKKGYLNKFIIACYFILTSNFLFAQFEISGSVKDSLDIPIDGVNILIFKNDSLKTFTFSKNGIYKINGLSKGIYKLEVSSMSYEKTSKIIELHKNEIVNFLLKDKLTQIKEVVIEVERDIEIKGDTIIFKADAFNKKKNIVVEDLLKSIPGISVEQDGTLKFQGKLITNVKIDNDDLFEGGYSVLTKNLNADVIDKIEVLQNYSRNPLLKNIRDTQDIALNLTLKEDRKANVLGNVELGFANKDRYDVNSNLISLLKKSKHYVLTDFNTIGDDVVSDINGILSSKNDDESYNLGRKESSATLTTLNTVRPVFDNRFVNFNTSKFTNINSIFNVSKNLKIKALGILFSDSKDYKSQNVTNFITEDPFTLIEDFNTSTKDKLGLGKLSVEWNIGKKKRLEYQGSFYNLKSNGVGDLVQNQVDIYEDLNSKTSRHNHFAHYTSRFKDSSAVVISARYINEDKPIEYLVKPYLYGEFFYPESESQTFEQSISIIDSKMNLKTIQFGYLNNGSKFNYESYLGFKNRNDDINSSLRFKDNAAGIFSANEDFNNDFELNSKLFYFYNRLRFSFGKIDVFTNVNLNYDRLKLENSEVIESSNYFFLNTSLNLKYQPNKKHELISGFRTNGNVTNASNLFNDFVQFNYRTFYKGIDHSSLLRSNVMYFNYRYGSWTDKFSANLNFRYTQNKNFISSNSSISLDLNTTEQIILDDSKNYILGVNFDRYIDFISSNLKLKTSYSRSEYIDLVNNFERNISSNNFNYGFEMRSAFNGAFNFTLGTEWRKIKFDINNSSAQNTNSKSFIDLDFSFSESLNLSIINERYGFGNLPKNDRSYYFTNIEAKYQFKGSKFSSSLRINNLYDNDSFDIFSLTDITTFTSRTPLINRYFMLGLNYRF
ncbi:carboxypeptidase-like regulatory domain-containing protein [Psychroserpens damuponensis]|uniref:carboxypeptidase-like regulatory domain-containing protein n=1 Tax=Psychroserpens damuponensis TaxID=943936 RepID=UPI000590A1CE|nr:carboxypeptidase-like regulatory domain-containing protein [Psychroserpens damuponensis]